MTSNQVRSGVPVGVHCYPVSAGSKYVPLLFEGIGDRYRPIYGELSLAPAITDADASGESILHVHWDEFVLRECRTGDEADAAVSRFRDDLAAFKARGGTVFWTVHNEVPHTIGFRDEFLAVRRLVADAADRILVHNEASIGALSRQVGLDRSKVRILPHPSYLGRCESEAALQDGLRRPHDAVIQCFGWIRRQKGIAEMVHGLPEAFLLPRGLRIRVSGHGEETAAVKAECAGRDDVEWDVRHVPDGEAASLLRSAACVVLPYERVLTSGVALLALSVGAMLVAVDVPQMRELLPPSPARFLYPRGDAAALRDAIDAVIALQPADRARTIEDNLVVARSLRPELVARRLADLYDECRAQPRRLRGG